MASQVVPEFAILPPSRAGTIADYGVWVVLSPKTTWLMALLQMIRPDAIQRDSGLSVSSDESFDSLVQPGASTPPQAEDLPGKLMLVVLRLSSSQPDLRYCAIV
jgi:hypothetical protein